VGALIAGKNVFGRAPPLSGSKSTISRFGERFCDGPYSLVSFLFAVTYTHGAPRSSPAICKSGGHVPPVFHGVGASAYIPRNSVRNHERH